MGLQQLRGDPCGRATRGRDGRRKIEPMNRTEVVRWPVPPGVPRWGALLWRAPQPASAALFTALRDRRAGSPLRRRVLTDALRAGMGLMNLGEADRALRFYDPACEIHVGAGFPLDAEPVYHGHAGWLAAIRLWEQEATLSFVADELLDMGGPCFTVLITMSLTGTKSGASPPPVQAVWTYTLRRGLIVRLDLRHDGWDAAPAELAAALRRLTPETAEPSPTPA